MQLQRGIREGEETLEDANDLTGGGITTPAPTETSVPYAKGSTPKNYITMFTNDEVMVFDAETTKFNIEGKEV